MVAAARRATATRCRFGRRRPLSAVVMLRLASCRFELVRRVGEGGAGVVFEARDRPSHAPVAVKLLHGGSDLAQERFEHEIELLAELPHPAIVRYIAHGIADDGRQYLVMEWLAGRTGRRAPRGRVARCVGPDACAAPSLRPRVRRAARHQSPRQQAGQPVPRGRRRQQRQDPRPRAGRSHLGHARGATGRRYRGHAAAHVTRAGAR